MKIMEFLMLIGNRFGEWMGNREFTCSGLTVSIITKLCLHINMAYIITYSNIVQLSMYVHVQDRYNSQRLQ